ncbi:MAG: hypothetical protein ACRC8Y_03825 [Chroococcales cyanobacterium]
MIISDLNHLETVSESQNIEGGLVNIGSPTTQVNVNILAQLANSTAIGLLGATSGAGNIADAFQGNLA